MEDNPVIVEAIFNVPAQRVWQAITDREQMKAWYFDLNEFRAEKGFEFRFSGQGHKGEQYLHICTVTEAIPNKKLQYSWRYEKYEGKSLVTFELTEVDGKTRVRLTHEGLDTFPEDNPDFARESFNEGWTEIITKSLQEFLKK